MISTNKEISNKLIVSNIYNKISIYFLLQKKEKAEALPMQSTQKK